MKNYWIIIPVFNRCAMTRACLRRLNDSGILDRFHVVVVDDASTDGTREMLEKEFPDVHIAEGNGQLFWGGGIAYGMEYAKTQGAEIYCWLNDDCLVDDGSIERLVKRARETKGICGGVCYEEDGKTVAYCGDVIINGKLSRVQPKPGERKPAELLNGNMVAIHKKVVDEIGVVDAGSFPHYGGDSIYALRASRAGHVVEIDGSATGINPRGDYFSKFGEVKPAAALFKDILWRGSPNYYPNYWNSLRAMFGWKAYFRWPAFFIRLFRLYVKARSRRGCPTDR